MAVSPGIDVAIYMMSRCCRAACVAAPMVGACATEQAHSGMTCTLQPPIMAHITLYLTNVLTEWQPRHASVLKSFSQAKTASSYQINRRSHPDLILRSLKRRVYREWMPSHGNWSIVISGEGLAD